MFQYSKSGGHKMAYFDSEKNKSIKQEILNDIKWYNQESEDFKKMLNDKKSQGLYFFREKKTRKIVYVGVGGLVSQSLGERLKQYIRPSDEGTKSFKCKVCEITDDKVKNNWKKFKKEYQKNWKEKFSEFEVGVILCTDYEHRDLRFEEAFAIAVLKPRYNFQ